MPRSLRDSDEEMETKSGRKTRGLIGSSVVDSPRRRSTRIKPLAKQNESSPDSPVSDVSVNSNTQITRVTRRRTGTMDSITAPEKNRTLRSGRNSVSLDINEIMESEGVSATPTKKTRNSALTQSNDTLKGKTRTSRAGSEAKSISPVARVTRRTRASSMEPESVTESLNKLKSQSEVSLTPVKTRRRASMIPSQATLVEEKEVNKVLVVSLDRTIPELNENTKNGSNSKSNGKSKELISRPDFDRDHENIDVTIVEESEEVEGLHKNSEENLSTDNFDNAKDTSTDDKTLTVKSNEETAETEEKLATEQLAENTSETSSSDNNQNTSKELQLGTENILNTTTEEQNMSNKENQTTNIILSDTISERGKDIKSLPSSPAVASKSIKEKQKLLSNESPATKRRYSKELSEVCETASPKAIKNNNDTGNDSVNSKMDISLDEANDSMENVQNVVVGKEKDLLKNESVENLDNSTVSVEMCSNSNSLNNSKVCNETAQDKCSPDISSHMDNSKNDKEGKETEEVIYSDNNVVNNDVEKEADLISNKNEIANTNKDEQSTEKTISQSVGGDSSESKEKVENLDTSEKVAGKDVIDCIQTLPSIHSNNVTDSKSPYISLTSAESSNILEDESIKSEVKNTNNASFVLTNGVSERSNLSSQSGASTSINKNDDYVINVIKCGQSSIVTDSPAEEPIKESPDNEELLTKTSATDTSLTSGRKSTDKSKSAENEKNPDNNLEVQKQNKESVDLDDNDSDAAAGILFQDISANEWKKKTDKNNDNSSVHSMSTERLDHESEAECDLILVDKDASSGPENVKLMKEKDSIDYDSDDTVVLKRQVDSRKTKDTEETTTDKLQEDSKMDISSDEVSNAGSKRRSLSEEKSLKEEASEKLLEDADSDIFNKSSKANVAAENLKEMDEQRTPKLNISRKSVGEKSLSKSSKIKETGEDSNKSLTDLKLNKSRLSSENNLTNKRKSLNKSNRSMQPENSEVDREEIRANENDESSGNEELGKSATRKKRKSLNKSNTKNIEEIEIPDSDNNSVNTSAKGNEKNKSLNTSSKKRLKLKTVIKDLIDESDSECTQSGNNEKTSSAKKKKSAKKHRSIVQIDSDSGDDKSNDSAGSNESGDESFKLPNFLFVKRDSSDTGSGSDNDDEDDKSSNKSVDSDIKREYNLDGEEITEFSDDNVRSDECRASELESSDPDDDGSDLADFIVGDDEDVEDEETSEQEEEKDVVEVDDGEDKVVEENDDEEKVVMEENDDQEKDVAEIDEEAENEDGTENEGSVDKEEEEGDDDDKVENEVVEEEIEDREVSKKRNNTQEDMETEELIVEERRLSDSGKKKKKLKQNVSSTDKTFNGVNTSDVSLGNSFNLKKTKLKQLSNEYVEEDIEQRLMDSEISSNINIQKFSKTMKCSTPKLKSSASEKFEAGNTVNDTSSQNSGKKSTNKANLSVEGVSSLKQRIANTSLIEVNTSKKLKKTKDHEKSLLHKSLPTDLVELVEKTNLSRPMSSRTTELNKTTLTPTTETPKTKYLKKDKLNESAPVLKSISDFKKSRSETNNKDKSLIEEEEEENQNDVVEQNSVEIKEEVNASMKRKVMKIADKILDTEKQKKHKKRKELNVQKKIDSQSKKSDSQENDALEITGEKRNIAGANSATSDNDIQQVIEITKEKKKKKKKKSGGVEKSISIEEESHEHLSANQSESTEDTTNERKNKKTKKKKQNKESENDNADIDACIEHIVYAKKNFDIKNVKKEAETVLGEKKSQEKLKASKATSIKSKSNKKVQKLQPSNVAVSDSDEAPEVVAFSKAREEALTVMKRTADNIRAHKEERKKRKFEHMDRMDQEKEIKMQKLGTKSESNKGNKLDVLKRGIKRLPTEVLDNLSDLPPKALKRRKVLKKQTEILPSRSMFDKDDSSVTNIHVEDNFSSLSLHGSTSQFDVVNLKKIKKQKKVPIAASFRQKMLARNARQPISAYLMYLEKQKSSGNTKFCNRPF